MQSASYAEVSVFNYSFTLCCGDAEIIVSSTLA